MRVTIFGTGYVGLVTGTCLAEVGNEVVCVDVDAGKVERLERGEIPIYRARARATGARQPRRRPPASSPPTPPPRSRMAQIQFIAVGTPPDEDGSADLTYVLTVARTIGRALIKPAVVVNKSTVPVGTADTVRATIAERARRARRRASSFDVVSNPEFLKEGAAVPTACARTASSSAPTAPRAVDVLKTLYAPFNRNHERIMVMDVRTAELTKYAANACWRPRSAS